MAITIADVAAQAGVSKTTVSRVLNGKGDLHESTAGRIRQVMTELGYVPSSRGVSVGRRRNCVVGLLVPSLSWPWIRDVIRGAVDVIEAGGYGVMIFACNGANGSMHGFSTQVSASVFDGLLVVQQEGTLDYIGGLHTRSRPVVVIDDRLVGGKFPSVSTTNYAGGRTAADHLLSIGRRRPLVVEGPSGFHCTDERTRGFLDAYAAAGWPVAPRRVLSGAFTYDSGRRAIQEALDDLLDFDAVFAHNDLSAIGALQRVQRDGRRVPEDVAVVGFDDVAQAAESSLTTIHQPCREMGDAAARLLLGSLDGVDTADIRTTIPTSLVVRGSTRVS